MRWFHAFVGPLWLGMVLAGCAPGQLNPPLPGLGADMPNVALMSDKIRDVFKSVKLTGTPRVSRVRQAPVTSLSDWIVCLRSDAEDDPREYALFLQKNDVADYRLALLIDQCAGETYGPLPTMMPIK